MLILPGLHSNLVCRVSHTSLEKHLCLKLDTVPSSQELRLHGEGLAGMCSECHWDCRIVVGPFLLHYSVPSVGWILQALAAKIQVSTEIYKLHFSDLQQLNLGKFSEEWQKLNPWGELWVPASISVPFLVHEA